MEKTKVTSNFPCPGSLTAFELQCLLVYWVSAENDWHPASSCTVICACVNPPRVLETRDASQLRPSSAIAFITSAHLSDRTG